jgi:predicted S18 family serine protease
LSSVLAVILVLCVGVLPQGGATGAIAGEVLGADGVAVAHAQVEIRTVGSSTASRTVFADGSGNFTVPSPPVGTYDMVVSANGFLTSKYDNIMVRQPQTQTRSRSIYCLV